MSALFIVYVVLFSVVEAGLIGLLIYKIIKDKKDKKEPAKEETKTQKDGEASKKTK